MTAVGERTPADESVRRLQTLVSPYTGVIRRVEEVLAEADETPLVAVTCETADGALLPLGPSSRVGSGSGDTRRSALVAALGEAVERYSAAGPASPDELVVGCAAELGREVVPPGRFALFHSEQYQDGCFPYRPFRDETRVCWVRASTIPRGEPALVPAQLVYLGDRYGPEPTRIGPSTSSGLACHATFEEAVLRGLFEVVERDAFMLVWSNRLSLPRLSWEHDAELRAFETRYLAPTGLRYEAIDLSEVWEIPSALGVVRAIEPTAGALGVGACSAPTVQEAVRKALDEACRVQAWATNLLLQEPGREFSLDCSDVVDFDDHVHYYAEPDRAQAADFLDASDKVRDVGEVETLRAESVHLLIEAVGSKLHAHGCSAYAVDVTAPDIRDAGIAVAKIVAPELCPLDADHRTRFLGGRRLYEAAFDLRLAGRPQSPAGLNPFPHPFP